MLSSTSVSPIGNIHRCVIVFTFVVQVQCVRQQRSRGGVRVTPPVDAVDGEWIFLYERIQWTGWKDSSQVVWGWLWQKAFAQSFMCPCTAILDTDPSVWTSWLWRCAQRKTEAKVRRIDSSLLFCQMKKMVKALFIELSTPCDRRGGCVKSARWDIFDGGWRTGQKQGLGSRTSTNPCLTLNSWTLKSLSSCWSASRSFFSMLKGSEKIHFVFLWSSCSCRVGHVQVFIWGELVQRGRRPVCEHGLGSRPVAWGQVAYRQRRKSWMMRTMDRLMSFWVCVCVCFMCKLCVGLLRTPC